MVASGVVCFTVGPNGRFSLADFILGAAWAPMVRSSTQTNVEIILGVLERQTGAQLRVMRAVLAEQE